MRVAHIIKVTRISGAERHLLVLLEGLRERAIDAHLIILVEPDKPMDHMLAEAQAVNIPIHRLVIRRDYDLMLVWHLYKTLKSIQPDIVHTHLIHADLFGFVAAKLARTRTLIVSRHNDDAFRYHPILRRVSKVMWWLAHGGIAISGSIRDFTVAVEGASPDKIDVVRYGLPYRWVADDEIYTARKRIREELELDNDAIIVGMVSRLVEQKGITYAIDAFKQLYDEHPTVHLVIAGDGELGNLLKAKAELLGIQERIHWLGWRNDVPTMMSAMDIFLFPSLWEGFGLVLLEAMSRRIPVVSTDVSAIPEVVDDHITGLLVPPHDPEALSNAIETLLHDRALRKHMGLLGEDRLEHKFSVDRMVSETIAVYQKRSNASLNL